MQFAISDAGACRAREGWRAIVIRREIVAARVADALDLQSGRFFDCDFDEWKLSDAKVESRQGE